MECADEGGCAAGLVNSRHRNVNRVEVPRLLRQLLHDGRRDTDRPRRPSYDHMCPTPVSVGLGSAHFVCMPTDGVNINVTATAVLSMHERRKGRIAAIN